MSPTGTSAFHTTRWSMVLHGSQEPQSTQLNELCRAYWRPLYAFSRRSGSSEADAEDLTQGFFAKMLSEGSFSLADPTRGKFRTFLLSAFRNYMRDSHRDRQALKRGGGVEHLALHGEEGDAAFVQLSADASPEAAFDKQWAHDVVRRAKEALTTEFAQGQRYELFLAVTSTGDILESYEALAARLHTTVDAVKSFALRVRRRFRVLLEQEIADTVALPTDVREEMNYLAELLRS
jgi:RNA polymerase sigma factor (sigma-70 family)